MKRDERIVIDCERLALRKLDLPDAAFILELLNEESFVRFIGDREVRTLGDAREYIVKGPLHSYRRYGFGLYLMSLREKAVPVGICGLVKRASLEDVDIGFALLPQYRCRGYAAEAAGAVLAYGRRVFGLKRIVAVTSPGNQASIAVLEKIGLRFERTIRLAEHAGDLKLFAAAW
jgi:ribosomal-protein-alanine N-acetyltransferase